MRYNHLLLTIAWLLYTIAGFTQVLHLLHGQYPEVNTTKDKIYGPDALSNNYTRTMEADLQTEMFGNCQINIASESGHMNLQALSYHLYGIRLLQSVPIEKKSNQAKEYFYDLIKIPKDNNLLFYASGAYSVLSRFYFYSFKKRKTWSCSGGEFKVNTKESAYVEFFMV